MTQISPTYDPKAHEEAVYKQWEQEGIFKPDNSLKGKPPDSALFDQAQSKQGKPFVIMLPPPNITGSLHMGHALQDTIMDILIRYHRMKGEPTLWQPGTDHAAIATNRVLEKQLVQEGTTRQAIGRQAFLARAKEWYDKTGHLITAQMKRLGSSPDWDRLVFTLDPAYVQAVQETFVRYYKKGYIYRGYRQVNWCPHCGSVVSDLEVKHEERPTKLITLRYPLVDGQQTIFVTTTRPETMLGDTAVAVHPADARYKKFIGKSVRLPLVGREIPIIADERIDKDFGTGAVKVTPAHDPLDAAIAATHQLPSINIIGEDGRLTEAAGQFAGQTVEEARQNILVKLTELGAVEKEEDHRHQVGLCERCSTVIEPLLSRQWFVNMQKLKGETITVVTEELIHFYPARWKEHFLTWMNNVQDWTISRQIWLGQQIPVWWKKGTRGTAQEEGNFIVSLEKPAGEWEQDPDVLDTWFSSALWPFATLGWPQPTPDLQKFYPTSVLVTARDILYLWVARMIFSGLELLQGEEYGNRSVENRIPFHDVLIHPTVLTKTGQRMSKSLGTGVDPLELIDQYGADATRFGLMFQMNYDRQAIKFDETAIKNARNFANKIWNIARFLLTLSNREDKTIADEWITGRVGEVTDQVTTLLNEYKIGEAARLLYDFVWRDFADWYIEILKIQGSLTTARTVFAQILKLLHPFMPHITEVLWSLWGEKNFLAKSDWPTGGKVAKSTYQEIERFQDTVTTVRSARTLLTLPPNAVIDLYLPGEVPLPSALQALSRATLLPEKKDNMKQFPLSTGRPIAIGSSAITKESLTAAGERLVKEEERLQKFIAKQREIITHMKGKAPQDALEEKEQLLEKTQIQLQEIKRSKEILES